MQFSTKADYGLRALLDIALHSDGEPVTLLDIARRQEISPSYLGQLVLSLQATGLVLSIRGRKGGFALTKPPSEINLEMVLRPLERRLTFAGCVDNPGICPRQEHCATHEMWCRLAGVLIRELSDITLTDLIRWHEEKNPEEKLTGFNDLSD